ncbi:MAG: molybdenum cofactor guanylyltransferase [bacterium]|nr:molybdenum cofactor guanylyltransferase [bacterium]
MWTEQAQKEMSVIILAGGRSTRMNVEKDKALLPVSGVRLIEKIARDIRPYFREIVVSAGRETMANYSFLPYRVVTDRESYQGPMMGVLTGLQVTRYPVNFVIACDIPEINIPFIEKMAGFTHDYDIVVPVSGEDKFEPLFAFYNRRVIPHIETLLGRGIRKIIELFSLCRVKYVPLEGQDWYYNLNTPEDYQRYVKNKNGPR